MTRKAWSDMGADSEDDLWTQGSSSYVHCSQWTERSGLSTDDAFETHGQAREDLPPQTPLEITLSEEEHRQLLERVPRDQSGAPTSVGSLKHATRECSKCPYLRTEAGCLHGVHCEDCHLPHRVRRNRPCKDKRDRLKRRDHRQQLESQTNPALSGDASVPLGGMPDSKLSL